MVVIRKGESVRRRDRKRNKGRQESVPLLKTVKYEDLLLLRDEKNKTKQTSNAKTYQRDKRQTFLANKTLFSSFRIELSVFKRRTTVRVSPKDTLTVTKPGTRRAYTISLLILNGFI